MQIPTHTLHWWRRHRASIALALCGYLTGASLPYYTQTPLSGHFLQRPVFRYHERGLRSSRDLKRAAPARTARPMTPPAPIFRLPRQASARSQSRAAEPRPRRSNASRASTPPRAAAPVPAREAARQTSSATFHAAADTSGEASAVPAPLAAPSFPAFGWTVHPVSRVPNWGAMHSPEEWNRSYGDMEEDDFVPVPRYDLRVLTIPLESLVSPFTDESIAPITAKLYYSTRHFGTYDIDAGEYTGTHPGVDLKLAPGTPIGAIAGGRVHDVRQNDTLGMHVIVEHRHPTDGTFFSIYGHLESASVREGQDVTPGQILGRVGMTGRTSAPHLHLQVDRGRPGVSAHTQETPSHAAAGPQQEQWTVHPIHFIARYAQSANVAAERRE